MFEGPVQDLIDALRRLPGIGQKSAQRLVFHLLRAPVIVRKSVAPPAVAALRA